MGCGDTPEDLLEKLSESIRRMKEQEEEICKGCGRPDKIGYCRCLSGPCD